MSSRLLVLWVISYCRQLHSYGFLLKMFYFYFSWLDNLRCRSSFRVWIRWFSAAKRKNWFRFSIFSGSFDLLINYQWENIDWDSVYWHSTVCTRVFQPDYSNSSESELSTNADQNPRELKLQQTEWRGYVWSGPRHVSELQSKWTNHTATHTHSLHNYQTASLTRLVGSQLRRLARLPPRTNQRRSITRALVVTIATPKSMCFDLPSDTLGEISFVTSISQRSMIISLSDPQGGIREDVQQRKSVKNIEDIQAQLAVNYWCTGYDLSTTV